jgi:uncharacterized protein (TIGR04255 family)
MKGEVLYPKAPITEALLDIRVTPNAAMPDPLDRLAEFVKTHADAYPEVKELVMGTSSIMLAGDAPPQASAQMERNGFVAFTAGRTRAIQARRDGFSASRLAPYTSWADLRAEAVPLWSEYRSIANPALITRIALRYINRIDIPHSIVELEEYIRTVPKISADLPQQMNNFFMQIHLPQVDLGAICILNSTMLPPNRPETVSILFDIDLFKVVSVPQEEQDIWDLFECMRIRKNQIFEGSITDKTRELFRDANHPY